MPNLNINHMALAKNWEVENEKVENPKTVIVGSFNPYNPKWGDDLPADFYYGRIPLRGPGNYLWPRIAYLTGKDPDYFQGNTVRKVEAMQEYGFVFFDLIDTIHLEGDSLNTLEKFANDRFYNSFDDSDVWKGSHRNPSVKIKRTYNERLIKFLNMRPSIEHVLITLGSGKGHLNFNKRELAWQSYKAGFKTAAGARLVSESWSPAPQGVEGDIEGFDSWLKTYLFK